MRRNDVFNKSAEKSIGEKQQVTFLSYITHQNTFQMLGELKI